MSAIRVLRISNSAVVPEHRRREQLLRERHGYDMHLVSPPAFAEGGRVVTATDDPDVPMHIVTTRGRRYHPILFWYITSQVRRVIREVRPQIVDLHQEPYSLAAAAALRAVAADAPDAKICIYTAQNILKRYPQPFRKLEQRALRLSAAAYPCSTEAGDVLRAKGFRGAVHVLPLGVSIRALAQRRFGIDDLRVGFLGRLEPYKGGELAIHAFARATEGLHATMEVVGAGSQRATLEACAAGVGVSSRVHFQGAVSHEEALTRIRGYDVVLVPSLTTATWKEQFGRIVVQALEAGTPVIASDSGSLREVLQDCGVLVREGDVDELTIQLRRLLHDPHSRAELSRSGRRRAEELFSWEAVADGTARMYRDMLGSG